MRGLSHVVAAVAAAGLLTGCTVGRIQQDATQALEWLRLKDGTRIEATGRWQLPRGTHIRVVETAPAPEPSWLAAAQAGVDSVFPASGPASEASYQLLVSWPRQDEGPRAAQVSLWEIIDLDQFRPDFLSPMDLQVALVRSTDGALVEAAVLRATPHWFASESGSPQLVHDAMRRFAGTYRSRY